MAYCPISSLYIDCEILLPNELTLEEQIQESLKDKEEGKVKPLGKVLEELDEE